MDAGASRFPDPYRRRDDLGHATVFLVVLLLLIAIGAVLFFGNAWVFSPPASVTNLGLPSSQAVPDLNLTPQPQATFTAPSPVPALAGIPVKETPKAGETPKPTTTPAPTMTASAANGAPTTTPTPVKITTPTPAAIANQVGYVANTGGDGVYLRHTPRLDDTWVAWQDNTRLTILGAEANGDGTHWLQVRDPSGHVGWIPAQYIRK
ncbi:MAG TPA: hypothetical protein VFZ25_21560 [Chloroflexota bacterium]|nr:hypothetical protein [Chloroflexota bacterium]